MAPIATTSSVPSTSASSSSNAAAPGTPPTLKTSLSPPRRQRQRQQRTIIAAAFEISSDVATLVAFSAFPFLGVQALADSGAGKKLKEDLEKRKPALLKLAAEAEGKRREAAKEETRFYGPQRGRWLPRALSNSLGEWAMAPHLPGEVAGDMGFDPLGLCREIKEGSKAPNTTNNKKKKQPGAHQRALLDAQLFGRYFELELLHARWAMLGALGAIVPEALSLAGLASFPEDRWQFVGRARLNGTDLNYFGIDGVAIIAGCQVLLMSGPELARSAGVASLEPLGIFLSGQDRNYPGGAFDPLNFANEDKLREEARLRVAEIKHGRLAMVAWVGFAAQALVGGTDSKGPLHGLVDLF